MCMTCGNFMAKSPNAPQPTVHSGPCHAVTMTAHASPAALTAKPCHTTEGVQRNTLGRPSAAAAHAAHVRASAMQHAQNACARAVGRHQSAVAIKGLSADFQLTQDLLAVLTNESAEAETAPCSVSRVSSRSSSLDRARHLDKMLTGGYLP
jgi:hypothetical protein